MVRVACLVSVLSVTVSVPNANCRELAGEMSGPSLPISLQTNEMAVQPERIAGKATAALRTLPIDADDKPAELLATHTDKRTRTTVEIGALGGGRADAPSLLHVGLGWTF